MLLLFLLSAVHVCSSRKLVDRFQNLSKAADLRKIAALGGDQSNISITGPILKPLLVPRVSGTESNKQVQAHIIKHFESLGWHIELDKFTDSTPFGPVEFTNIIVTRDITSHKRLTFAAHFDSKYFKNFEFIGATDSSVPCAILMDMAATLNNLLKLKEDNDDRYSTLQIVFFDGEEAVGNLNVDQSTGQMTIRSMVHDIWPSSGPKL